jgi:hypothetical protein
MAVIAVYAGCLGNGFLTYDDPSYVTANAAAHGFSAEHLRVAFTRIYTGNWAPLHLVSYMLDYTLWGLRPMGFILTNILLHASNAILFYHLLVRTRSGRAVALFSAFVFALHPVQVESVAWISERKTVLSMFFCLISLHAHIGFRENGGRRWYLISLLAFVCALLTKSVTIILPAIIMLYDLIFPEKWEKKRLVGIVPYVSAAAACATIALLTQAEGSGGIRDYHGGSVGATILTMLPVFTAYLRMLFWPTNLSLVYMPEVKTSVDVQVAAAAIVLLTVVGGGLLLLRRERQLTFWLAVFFVCLLPVAQLVPLITIMNDRYLYFPLIGAAPFCVGLAAMAVRKWSSIRGLAALAAGVAIVSLAILSRERTKVWRDDVTLWQDTVKKMPDSMFALQNLARTYTREGMPELAREAAGRVFALQERVPQPGKPERYDMFWNLREKRIQLKREPI